MFTESFRERVLFVYAHPTIVAKDVPPIQNPIKIANAKLHTP
jgi:hypothetical protein